MSSPKSKILEAHEELKREALPVSDQLLPMVQQFLTKTGLQVRSVTFGFDPVESYGLSPDTICSGVTVYTETAP
jgi:hypothetical protein